MLSTYRAFGLSLFAVVIAVLLSCPACSSPLDLKQQASSSDLTEEQIYEAYRVWKGSLHKRDVVAPPITKPDASSVWPIGTTQEVLWDTSELPAEDSQITNPIGRVILGRDTGNSLNLNLTHPLAEGFSIRLGRITVTVPDVPPYPNYLIVLMGDSGNTSPSFAITSIAGGGSPPPPSSTPEDDPNLESFPQVHSSSTPSGPLTSTTSTLITDPIPISGTTITGGSGTTTPVTDFEFSATTSPSADAQTTQGNQDSAASRLGISSALVVGCSVGAWIVMGL